MAISRLIAIPRSVSAQSPMIVDAPCDDFVIDGDGDRVHTTDGVLGDVESGLIIGVEIRIEAREHALLLIGPKPKLRKVNGAEH